MFDMTTMLCAFGFACTIIGVKTFALSVDDSNSATVRKISGVTTAASLITILAIYTNI
ncbi:hypothetical protein [Paenibacillus piri]|uniref:hypothetical protein n=1 Tax=Paenibacillus piri TaxID=2547395 RepID=UPI00140444A7|nr:hypothetical protein [Paenibacillus piri]